MIDARWWQLTMKRLWPLMLKSRHEAVLVENLYLRSVVSTLAADLRKHRSLIVDVRAGIEQSIELVDRNRGRAT